MGEIADMLLEGTMCQTCGQYMEDGDGVPQSCPGCVDDGKAPDPIKRQEGHVACDPIFTMVRRRDSGEMLFMIQSIPESPSAVGIVLADVIRHYAKAYEKEGKLSYAEAVLAINGMLTKEMSKPSDDIQIVYAPGEEPSRKDEGHIDVSDWTDDDWARVDANRGDLSREEFLQRLARDVVDGNMPVESLKN
jgi:hypothetical protein